MALEYNQKVSQDTQAGIRELCLKYITNSEIPTIVGGMTRENFQNPIPHFQSIALSIAGNLYNEDGFPISSISLELLKVDTQTNRIELVEPVSRAVRTLTNVRVTNTGEMCEVASHRALMWSNALTYQKLYIDNKKPQSGNSEKNAEKRAQFLNTAIAQHIVGLRELPSHVGETSSWNIPINVRVGLLTEALFLHEVVKYMSYAAKNAGSAANYLRHFTEELVAYPICLSEMAPPLTDSDLQKKQANIDALARVTVPAFILPSFI